MSNDEVQCQDCDDTGWLWKRVDVDAEKKVPCECSPQEPKCCPACEEC